MDALGRLIEVYEDPNDLNPNGVNYQTSYLYDALDNLASVTQGSQQRFFMYDSLKRLIRADNPEQETLSALTLTDPVTNHSNWSVKYEYDSNGNLTFKTDARGVVTENRYDELNRLTTVLYRINGQPDPNAGDIQYVYDNAAYGKGRLWLTYRWGAKPSHTSVGEYDAMGRVKQLWNLFGDGQGGWSAGYGVSRNYNLAGDVTSQNYPSGHTVSYAYDTAGRTTFFTGNLGDGVTRTYASSFVYNSRSQVTQELFETQAPLYHKLQYNVRGQLWDVRVSTNPDVNGSLNRGGLQYFYDSSFGYGTSGPDNNGNVRLANFYTPEDEQLDHWAITRQSYTYDSINRLKSVTEYFANYAHPESQQQSVQTYDYDRWGNRTINTAQSSGTGINNTAFEVESARNRLYSPGDLALSESQRRIGYDKAGNQVKDTYTGFGTATFDGDNHIVAIPDKFGGSSTYTYNANAQRVRRRINNQETWQIYGIDGELVAEYAANNAVGTPQKEYGYRDGQLLITAETPVTNRTNVALSANGATATASSYLGAPYNYYASYVNDGQRTSANNNIWLDNTYQSFPDWVEINFNGTKTINEIDVVTQQDSNGNPVEPTLDMTFASWGATAFEVQYWNGTSWATVPNGSVTGNNKVWRQFKFANITTSKIRVTVNTMVDNAYSRVVEVEAWTPPLQTNYALPANGGSATASSYLGPPYNYYASYVNDGQRTAAHQNIWLDNTYQSFPDWVQIDFNGTKTINEIDVVTQQDSNGNPVEPTLGMTFASWGATAFEVQYWNGTSWATVPNGSVTGNNKVWRQFTFANITTSKIRVTVNAMVDNAYSRVVEVEAWGEASGGISPNIHWLVSDHLGTPRIILDQTGSFATTRRHDYLPFGEELYAGTGGRTTTMGYVAGDGVRQQFTKKERDFETGLDYFLARHYSSLQGRFTSPDEFTGGPDELFDFAEDASANPTFYAELANPQSLNKYQYTYNNPLNLTDPDGHCPPCFAAAAAAVVILLSPDTTHAPTGNEKEPITRSGDGVQKIVLNGAATAPIVRTVIAVDSARQRAAEAERAARQAETDRLAQKVADEAQASGVRTGSGGATIARTGQRYTALSGESKLHPLVQKIYDQVPRKLRERFHGNCCEGNTASQMLNAGVKPRGATYSVVRIRRPGHPDHGTPQEACSSCAYLLKRLDSIFK